MEKIVSGSMKYITIFKVEMNPNNRNTQAWVIKRCDSDRDMEGHVTIHGLPCRPFDVPLGTEFKTILTIKK
jgi:hypothetical protein